MQEYNAIIIGSGQAGTPLAFKLAGEGQKVAFIEKKTPGRHLPQCGLHPYQSLRSQRPPPLGCPGREGERKSGGFGSRSLGVWEFGGLGKDLRGGGRIYSSSRIFRNGGARPT